MLKLPTETMNIMNILKVKMKPMKKAIGPGEISAGKNILPMLLMKLMMKKKKNTNPNRGNTMPLMSPMKVKKKKSPTNPILQKEERKTVLSARPDKLLCAIQSIEQDLMEYTCLQERQLALQTNLPSQSQFQSSHCLQRSHLFSKKFAGLKKMFLCLFLNKSLLKHA